MTLTFLLPWLVLLGYGVVVYLLASHRVSADQFFQGGSERGQAPGFWLLVASAAISWIFAKSINNAANLGEAFGITGGIGYALYYLSFFVAAGAVYFLRVRGGYTSLSGFLTDKYGAVCARLFLIAVAIRLFNEVWSNTKVTALYFGPEGSGAYWVAVLAVTAFTVYYSLQGGLRSSLLTDSAQMVGAAALLVVVLAVLGPGLAARGLPDVVPQTRWAGLTFCGLALVQVLSYPFHDPVLTDRAFLTRPRTMVRGFITAGFISGTFILLFSAVGLYARYLDVPGDPTVVVPAAFGLPMLLVFNAIMLTSAGSTLDSTFASTSKLAARDWPDRHGPPTEKQVRSGRWIMVLIAVLGNLPLLTVYLGDALGPAIIAATTISGTMVMGLAPIFLLSFIRRAGRASFHLAFWPGLLLGVLLVIENAASVGIFPAWIDIGIGPYADTLGVNVYGLILCTAGYLLGTYFGDGTGERKPASATRGALTEV